MSDIGPGDYVEYVGPRWFQFEPCAFRWLDPTTWFPREITGFPLGSLKRVASLETDGRCRACDDRHPWLLMADDDRALWCPALWRRVYRPKAETLARLARRVPETTGGL